MSENQDSSEPLSIAQMRQVKETIDPLIRMMNQGELTEFSQFVLRVTDRYGVEHYGEKWREQKGADG